MSAPTEEADPEPETYVQLDDPQERDEEQVKGHKETEGAAHVRDGLTRCRWYQQVGGRERHRGGVGGIQGGDKGEVAPELPVVSARHSRGETLQEDTTQQQKQTAAATSTKHKQIFTPSMDCDRIYVINKCAVY